MADVVISPNMNLPVPVIGVDTGPDWANNTNACWGITDQHTHAPGSGVQITPAGLNINSSLAINGNQISSAGGVNLQAQSSAPAINTVYESGNDLHFVDGLGNDIPITANGSVAGTPGSIASLASPASASYVSGSSTFVWQSNVNTAANMDAGSLLMRNLTPNSTNALTLQPPAALASNYSITLPTLPAGASVLAMDSSGVISTQPAAFLMPTGAVIAYMNSSAPTGYLICNGSAVSRTTYAALFSVIGITNGQGDGSTTFNLPDLRGMFLRGVDSGRGVDPDANTRIAPATGGNAGDDVGSFENQAYLSHVHGLTQSPHGHPTDIGVPGGAAAGPGTQFGTGTAAFNTEAVDIVISVDAAGGSETRPVNIYVTYIIKT